MKESKLKSFLKTWLPPLVVLIVLIVVLELLGRYTSLGENLIFPVPSKIWGGIVDVMTISPVDYTSTFSHVILGYIIAIPISFILAGLLAQNGVVFKAVHPLVLVIATMPMVVIMPILFIWMKFAPFTRTLTVIITTIPQILLNVLTGFTNVTADKEMLASVYGMNRWDRFFKVVVPQAIPRIFVGLRLGVMQSTLGAVSSELVGGGGDRGLGYRVSLSCMYNEVPRAYGCIVMMAVTAYILMSVVTSIEKRVTAKYM